MTENPFQLPGYQVIGMQDTGVAFDVHLQPPSPVACSSCGTIGDFVKNGTRDIRVMDLPVHGKPVPLSFLNNRERDSAVNIQTRATWDSSRCQDDRTTSSVH